MIFKQLPPNVQDRIRETWDVRDWSMVHLVSRNLERIVLVCINTTRVIDLNLCIVWNGVRRVGYDPKMMELYLWEGTNE